MKTLLVLLMLILPSVAAAQAVTPHERQIISCYVSASTATSLTAVGGSCAAPGAAVRLYITDVIFGASAVSSTAADSAFTLKYGTGGTCGSGTTSIAGAPSLANTTVSIHFQAPLILPKNNELCWIHSVAGTKWAIINGFIEK
jgi:hypothetical protein